MTGSLITVAIHHEHDVVAARQRSRQIAEMLGFDRIDQTRIATAVSEITRNAFQYAGGGRVEFCVEGDTAPQLLVIRVADRGPGIANVRAVLSGEYRSTTGMGIGVAGARRLMDQFAIDSSPAGTSVQLTKLLPARAKYLGPSDIGRLSQKLTSQRPESPLEEVQQQNQELVRTLEALRGRQDEIERVNRELEDTNRGVVALYAELDERADHLRRADELKTKFLSNMTHEFRTPVNSILALARLLTERLELNDSDKNELYYIRKSAQQLSDLVDDLLDIAKVDAGKIVVHPATFEVRGLFGALRGMLRPLLISSSLSLVFEDPVDLPPMYTDETKISQILRNLISNALKYTEAGEVRVRATLLRGADRIEFTVSDTGIGIPEAELPRIFEDFVQIENPLQRRVKGTGLGLPLSRRLAELLGGQIAVTSVLGEGTTFTLTVPLMYRDPVSVVAPALSPGRTPILLVEDSDEDALVYHRLLAETRYEIVHARSAEIAQQLLNQFTPAAVLLDIHLHGREAWDLLIQLKRDGVTSNVPVLVLSTADHRRKAFGLGATGFGLKPVDRGWLLRTLEAAHTESPVRVLTIDDEETFRFVVREALGSADFRVEEASTGTAGLALIPSFQPDVVLVDLGLPDMTGEELTERLAADPVTQDLPFVVITSRPVSGGLPESLRRAARIIPKGTLSREVLRAAIRDAVRVSPVV
jgi:signal transduction histidine kinase/DNA-binding response OmpR family regulator